MSQTLMVTGGAGFIGSALIRHLINNTPYHVINIDKLTYAGNLESLESVAGSERYGFEQVDVCDGMALRSLFAKYRPDGVLHLAAETHVDRSIDGPAAFIETNVLGTYQLLEASREYLGTLPSEAQAAFRFVHVSTDEVFGSLGAEGFFTETTAYDPRSPYSASKASSDHLARAWFHTYGVPVIVTNCSNNYGPYQFPEKLIPVVIQKALANEAIPVYGKGDNVRDWLFVDDHARALHRVYEAGTPGETYAIGGHNEHSNIDVVNRICSLLNDLRPGTNHHQLITFVTDRPGHDKRYAINATRIQRELGWQPAETFESGLARTVRWYLENQAWCQRVLDGSYRLERLGVTGAES